jgi:TolB-like protein
MAIWSSEIKELEKLYESLKGQLPDLEKELVRLVKADDENMVLLYSRRCLEIIITDLCECELKRPRKTEPLKGIIDKLHKEDMVPSHIITSMHGLNELSTYGAHPKDFDPEQVKPVLVNLDIIIKWYLKYREIGKDIKVKQAEEVGQNIDSTKNSRQTYTPPKKKLIRIVSGSILLIAIVVAVLFFTKIIGGSKQAKELDKSIAVLPFKLLSDEPDKQFMADGMMEAITLHLSKIKDLRVMSTTSVEQYRSNKKTNKTIGQELDVAYLLKGSFQKFGDNVKLIVQLIKASEDSYKWGDEYNSRWSEIFPLQSKIAQKIAGELDAVISPEEKQLIEKVPTADSTAYAFYLKGREEHTHFWIDNNDTAALGKSEGFYRKAMEYDSTFAAAYTGLARVYWDRHFFKDYLLRNFQDSTIILCKIALLYDDQISEAYTLNGLYNSDIGKSEQAIEEFDKAIRFNPNDWMAYRGKARLYARNDFVSNIKYLQKAISINRGPELPALLEEIGGVYFSDAGFPEKAKQSYQDKLKLDGDSAAYYNLLAWDEFWFTNLNKSIEFGLMGYAIDSTNVHTLLVLGENYSWLGRYKESLKYFKKWYERLKTQGALFMNSPFNGNLYNNMHRIGYSYRQNGYEKEAENYFNEQINYCNRMIDLKRLYAQSLYPYYDLAGVYAFTGEREKAYKNLRIFNQRKTECLWMVMLIRTDPLFNSIRNEPEFQQIVRDVEAKYQSEHERVRKWLEDQGMLLPGDA